jgi:hypothetical protein
VKQAAGKLDVLIQTARTGQRATGSGSARLNYTARRIECLAEQTLAILCYNRPANSGPARSMHPLTSRPATVCWIGAWRIRSRGAAPWLWLHR